MQAADYSKTEQQILSKELKEDKKLKLSIENFDKASNLSAEDKLKNLIATQPINCQSLQDKLNALRKSVSCPNNYVFTSLLEGIYKKDEDLYTGEKGRDLHGEVVYQELRIGNWKLLTVGYNEGNSNGYSGAAYWNPDTQQVIIVHSGTKNIGGAVADIKGVFLNHHTSQIDSAITFTDKIISVLKEVNKEKGSNIQLFITGHSLGAWLGPITAFSAKYLKKEGDYFVANDDFEKTGYHASTVIFDAPGCEEMLRRIQKSIMNRYIPSLIDSLDITNYLTIPNLINACNLQVGEVCKIFINLSKREKEDLQKMNIISYTRSTHQIIKIKEVFDPKTGEILKDKDGNLRIKRVRDWPLLISGDEDRGHQNKALWIAKTVAQFIPVVGQVVKLGEIAYVAGSSVKWYAEFKKELDDFFKLANATNNFHFSNESALRSVRYKTESLGENYKNRRKLNAFTQPERQFLERYKLLEKYQDLPSTFKLTQLFDDFGQELKNKTIKFLRECEVKDGAVYSSDLLEFIPYIKSMLHFFPEMKSEVENACQNFSADILCGIYQLASSSYLNSMKNSLDFGKDTFGLGTFLEDNNLKVLHTVQSSAYLGAMKVYKTFKVTENDCYGNNDHAFLNLDRVL